MVRFFRLLKRMLLVESYLFTMNGKHCRQTFGQLYPPCFRVFRVRRSLAESFGGLVRRAPPFGGGLQPFMKC